MIAHVREAREGGLPASAKAAWSHSLEWQWPTRWLLGELRVNTAHLRAFVDCVCCVHADVISIRLNGVKELSRMLAGGGDPVAFVDVSSLLCHYSVSGAAYALACGHVPMLPCDELLRRPLPHVPVGGLHIAFTVCLSAWMMFCRKCLLRCGPRPVSPSVPNGSTRCSGRHSR